MSMTPEQLQAWRWEREIDERNRPLTDEELDAMFPEGYKVCVPFFIAYNSLVAIIMSKHYLKVFTVMFMFLLHRSCLHQQAMCRSVLRPVSCQPLPHLLEAWQASTCRQRTAPQNRWMTSPQETSPSSNLMTSSILTNCWWASKLCAQHV